MKAKISKEGLGLINRRLLFPSPDDMVKSIVNQTVKRTQTAFYTDHHHD